MAKRSKKSSESKEAFYKAAVSFTPEHWAFLEEEAENSEHSPSRSGIIGTALELLKKHREETKKREIAAQEKGERQVEEARKKK